MNMMSREDFISKGIDQVLKTLDLYIGEVCNNNNCAGWKDKDLGLLLPVLEKHFNTIADRFSDPESKEVGSANFPKLI